MEVIPYVDIAVDYEGKTAIDFGVYGAPETFLIDDDGVHPITSILVP